MAVNLLFECRQALKIGSHTLIEHDAENYAKRCDIKK